MMRRLLFPLTAAIPGSAPLAIPASALPGDRATSFGPRGYGRIKLGMSLKAARKTGLITKPSVQGACDSFSLKGTTAGTYHEKKRGVTALFADKSMRTPRGIKLGDKFKKVKKAYPGLKTGPNVHSVRVPGNRKALYLFLFDGSNRLYELGLALTPIRCFN